MASLVVLVVSLVEANGKPLVDADRLHRCGLELADLELRIDTRLTPREALNIATEYRAILERCPVNHEPIDDLYFRLSHSHEFPRIEKLGRWSKFRIQYRYSASNLVWACVIAMLIVGITLGLSTLTANAVRI